MGYGNVAPAPVMSAASTCALTRLAATPAAPTIRPSIASPEVIWTAALASVFPEYCRFVTATPRGAAPCHKTVMPRRYLWRPVLQSTIGHNGAATAMGVNEHLSKQFDAELE